MADVIEDLDIIVTRALNFLTQLLYALCRRLEENSHRPLSRRTLVRWLAAFMPRPKDPRLQLQSILGVAGRPSLDRWASCGSLGSVLSSASINYLMEEDLGDNVVRFRLGNGDEDSGGDLLEDPVFLPDSKLHDLQALTSTPKFSRALSCTSLVSNDTTAREKLLEMEEELAILRKQIAVLVMAQESSTSARTIKDKEPDPTNTCKAAGLALPSSPGGLSLDDSGCESEVVQGKSGFPYSSHEQTSTVFAPPPPPPPPGLNVQTSSPTQHVQQGKTRLWSYSNLPSRGRAEMKQEHKPDMAAVLKDLSNVRLRAVERSPGGTPMRRRPEREPTDPAEIIAQALKKKFSSHWGFSPESDKENESSSFVSDQSSPLSHNRASRRLDLAGDSSNNWTSVTSPVKA